MAPKKPTRKPRSADVEGKTPFNVTEHTLVPKHEVCTQEERKHVLEHYKIQPNQLPRINAHDPAIRHLGVKIGDIIRVTRASETAGDAEFYRIVASE
jgi:DNA-directed RNA polymerase subunit H